MLIISTSSFEYNVFAEDNVVSADTDIEQFIEETTDIIAEYDDDRNYTVSSSSLDFQTCRLIVEQSQDFNPLNSVAVADGYKDFHIVQFENEADTKSAYEYYSRSENVTSVDIDSVVECFDYNPDNSNFDTYDVNNCMSPNTTMKTNIVSAKQYLLDNVNKFEDVYVAVIDSGVYKEHEAITGRFAGGYDYQDSSDKDGSVDTFGHGTKVAGVIIDNTLPNVKIRSYRVSDETGRSPTSIVAVAVQQAILDDVDVINLSLGTQSNSTVLKSAIEDAYNANINIVAASGNDSYDLNTTRIYPACYDEVIAVGGAVHSTSGVVTAYYSNYGIDVEIYAFGNVTTTNNNGGYSSVYGTSFASPCVAAECANIKTMYPDEENEYVLQRMLDGSVYEVQMDDFEKCCFLDMYNPLVMEKPTIRATSTPYAKIIINEDGTKTVECFCDDKDAIIYYGSNRRYTEPLTYSKDVDVRFFAKSKCNRVSVNEYVMVRFGFTKDGFYCDENGIITSFVPYEYPGDPSNLIVPDKIEDIEVMGFVPMSRFGLSFFASSIYSQIGYSLESIVIPERVTSLSFCLFNGCKNLVSVTAPGVTQIDGFALNKCSKLENLTVGDIKEIGNNSFWGVNSLKEFPDFKELTTIPKEALAHTNIESIDLTNCKSIGDYAFCACDNLKYVYAPICETVGQYSFKLSEIKTVIMPNATQISQWAFLDAQALETAIFPKVTQVGRNAFENTYSLNHVDLSSYRSTLDENMHYDDLYLFDNSGIKSIVLNVEDAVYLDIFENCHLDYIYLPYATDVELYHVDCKRIELEKAEYFGCFLNQNQIAAVPSSVKEVFIGKDENWQNIVSDEYIVYGTEGTYIYNWCIENGVNFKNISQETAIITDLPMEITDADTTLTADVIGFNRTYQWYSNTVADNTTGTAIDGATSKTFVPADYPLANYYYCVVTSKDGDYAPVTITTGVTENKSYILSDYSAYSAALASAQAIIDNPDYEDKYDTDTRTNFENLLNELILDMTKSYSQTKIDRTTNSIIELINGLKVSNYIVNFKVFVDNKECYSSKEVKPYASKNNLDVPDIDGYDYSSLSIEKWTVESLETGSRTLISKGNTTLESIITEDVLISVYLVSKPNGGKNYSKVTLLSQTGSIVGIGYVENGCVIDTSSATVLWDDIIIGTASIIPFYNFSSWTFDGEKVSSVNVNSDVILRAEYICASDNVCKVISGSENVLVNSQFNPKGYNATYDERVYLISLNNKYLAIFDENGILISYLKNTGYISAPMTSAIIIKEVDSVESSTSITGMFITKQDNNKKKISFNCQFFIPDDCKFVECGALITGNKDVAVNENIFVIGAEKTLKAISQSQSENNEYTISVITDITDKQAFYGRSYLIFIDSNGNKQTVYGNIHNVNLIEGDL